MTPAENPFFVFVKDLLMMEAPPLRRVEKTRILGSMKHSIQILTTFEISINNSKNQKPKGPILRQVQRQICVDCRRKFWTGSFFCPSISNEVADMII
jgi:hypothetical protein